MPQDALLGTDVVTLASLISNPQVIVPGTYRSEQGGALATVQLERRSQTMTLTRRFQEPGGLSHSKTFRGLTVTAAGHRLAGAAIEVIGVKDGLIVLETASEVESLPESLWIVYEPARARAGKKAN